MMGRPIKQPKPTPLMAPLPSHIRYKGTPAGLSAVKLKPDQTKLLQSQALDIFTVMSNAGKPLAESLAAILLTGINWGANASKERVHDAHNV